MDVAFQLKLKELERRLPHFVTSRVKGGSGFPLSELLRWYFWEYLNRLNKHGPESFPLSFNVVQSFMRFNREYMLFDLRDEVEHLISINDYFRWYDSGDMPKEPRSLQDILTEGTIYSYEIVSDPGALRICGDSQQVFAGVSFVRHDWELSCLLLAGENPPLHSDRDVLDSQPMTPAPGREGFAPAPELTVQDRYLDGYGGFAKVIVLTRFDLRNGKHDVRYVLLDDGPLFSVLTDDASVFRDLPPADVEAYRQAAIDGLERYDDLFSALAAMIYLPAFFAVQPDSVQEFEVSTQLHAMREDKRVRQTIEELGESQCVSRRSIRCLGVAFGRDEVSERKITPPEMQFKCDGYWKAIGPQELGEDKNGDLVVGRTWVSRHESWSARSPQSFMLLRNKRDLDGPDPGVVYIQRSAAHDVNVYKVGLTRRSADVRAAELSSATGVPLPFGVLANWEVGDCALVEQRIHQRLAAFRINPRREFFRCELSLIVQTIGAVINELV
ncbi:MAG TPA: GIY-YIG nuclease family protein [Thermoguttaceae bacterium]|nr:GIY-YIG nuclease family protein [Thermoguttaceae bacterium]